MSNEAPPVVDEPPPLAPEWLLEPLPTPEAPTELETSDSRFEAISALILRGDYIDAGRRAETLLREGAYDVRVLGYYLFGAFIERGLSNLPLMFRTLSKFINNKFEGFGPSHKKQIQSENMLLWLLSGVLKNVELHSTLKDETWKQWLDPKHRPAVDEAMTLCPEIQLALSNFAPQSRAALRFQSLDGWLGGFGHSETGVTKRSTESTTADSKGSKSSPQSKNSSSSEEKSSASKPSDDHAGDENEDEAGKADGEREEDADEDELALDGGEDEDDEDADDSFATRPRIRDGQRPGFYDEEERTGKNPRAPHERLSDRGRPGGAEMPHLHVPSAEEGSAQWRKLLDRLQAFEVLVQKGLYLKAAIVAADIQSVIASFDPVAFFPSLFQPFLSSFADHMRPLEHYLNDADSVKWKVLQKLYQVDFEGFLRKE